MFDGISGACELVGVQADHFPRWHGLVFPHIAKMAAGSGGRYLPEDICTAIMERDMQLWVIMEGADVVCAFVTSIVVYPRAKALRFMGCVGRGWKRWVHHRETVEAWARGMGATLAEAWVPHPKWGLIFEGYEVDHMMLVKSL